MRSLILFKNNLRYYDNPILYYGSFSSKVLTSYIHDEVNTHKKIGRASKYWLYKSLKSLNKSLDNNLLFLKGDTIKIAENLIEKFSINNVYIEEPFLQHDIKIYNKLQKKLKKLEVNLIAYNCNLLWSPESICKNDRSPYKVFSPFYKKGCLLNEKQPNKPLGPPKLLNFIRTENKPSIDDLNLKGNHPWHEKLASYWHISENAALDVLTDFIKTKAYDYKNGRDYPCLNKNSRLSPYIRFGLISVNRIWWELEKIKQDKNIEHYKSELGWREFSYYLLYHFPNIQEENLQKKFDAFKWENSKTKFHAWKTGNTGYPIVDAGMRELWETGYIHNRIRMVVASFLVKNLLIDWRLGEKWFWDCLVDADYASNVASWQWVAGTGADAAPYFRIFNPMLQGNKFDPKGEYTLRFLPELKDVPIKLLQNPWEAGMDLDYSEPIINYKDSREKSLSKYSELKK
tara:strand:- start:9110 stop:10483 length:1374 start_codon:yes stop_codon:yes gene_type:complete